MGRPPAPTGHGRPKPCNALRQVNRASIKHRRDTTRQSIMGQGKQRVGLTFAGRVSAALGGTGTPSDVMTTRLSTERIRNL